MSRKDLIDEVTRNCFTWLNNCGLQATNNGEDGEVDQIPLEVKVFPGKTPFGGLRIYFLRNGEKKLYFPKKTKTPKGRIVCGNDLAKIAERSKAIFYNLSHLWERFDCSLKSLLLKFGFTPGGDLVITGPVDEKFWKLETQQRTFAVKRVGENMVHICPEWMPILVESQKKKLGEIIGRLGDDKQDVMIVKKQGWQKKIAVVKDLKEWHIVFPNDAGPDLIKGRESLLEERIKFLENGCESVVVIKTHSSNGSVLVRKDEQGRIVLFLGHIPDLTDEQAAQLSNTIEHLETFQRQEMIAGEEWDNRGIQKILILKYQGNVALIPAHVFESLEGGEKSELLDSIEKVQEEGVLIVQKTPARLTDLSQIAEFSQQFSPDSPSKKKE